MKQKINKNSLLFKTSIILISFSVFILLLSYFFQIQYSNFYYEKHKINEVNKIVKNIDMNSIEKYLEKISLEKDVCIEYRLNNGSIFYNEGEKGCLLSYQSSKITKLKEQMYESSQTEIFYKITNPLFNSKSFLFGKRLSNGAYIYINSQLESLDSTYIVLKNQLVYLLIIVIGVAFLISIILSATIIRPILNITRKAKRLGEGDLEVEFDVSSISEINDLANSLNYAKNEMIKTDDYRRDLMANVGHDLKTPLTLIKSYAEMVRDITYSDSEKRTSNLNVIINETDRLNALVNDILTLTKIEATEKNLNIEEYDLIEQIKEIIANFEILSITENYNFIYTGPEKILISADKIKISQVIYNLINNAINYTGNDCKVYINVIEKKKSIKVEITDTGKGIEEKDIEHIWSRYYKTEKKHKRNKVGTGLGLSIVKEILQNHKFEYGVKSKVGKGTTFYFVITKNK